MLIKSILDDGNAPDAWWHLFKMGGRGCGHRGARGNRSIDHFVNNELKRRVEHLGRLMMQIQRAPVVGRSEAGGAASGGGGVEGNDAERSYPDSDSGDEHEEEKRKEGDDGGGVHASKVSASTGNVITPSKGGGKEGMTSKSRETTSCATFECDVSLFRDPRSFFESVRRFALERERQRNAPTDLSMGGQRSQSSHIGDGGDGGKGDKGGNGGARFSPTQVAAESWDSFTWVSQDEPNDIRSNVASITVAATGLRLFGARWDEKEEWVSSASTAGAACGGEGLSHPTPGPCLVLRLVHTGGNAQPLAATAAQNLSQKNVRHHICCPLFVDRADGVEEEDETDGVDER